MKKTVGDSIFEDVLAAMQNAEEMGGPEGEDYNRLMERIENEARVRRENHVAMQAMMKERT